MSGYVPPRPELLIYLELFFSVLRIAEIKKPQNNMGNACLKEIMLLIDVEAKGFSLVL